MEKSVAAVNHSHLSTWRDSRGNQRLSIFLSIDKGSAEEGCGGSATQWEERRAYFHLEPRGAAGDSAAVKHKILSINMWRFMGVGRCHQKTS